MKKVLGIIFGIILVALAIAVIVAVNLGLFDTMGKVVKQMLGNGDNVTMDTSEMDSMDGDSQSFAAGDVQQLKLNCQYGTFNVEKGDGEDIQIVVKNNSDNVKYSLKEGVLTIATDSKISIGDADEVEMTLYVPNIVLFTTADIDIGAGVLNFSDIMLSKMNINVGAGQINMNNVSASDVIYELGAGEANNSNTDFSSLDLNVGAGAFNYDGYIAHDMNLNCSVGKIQMNLEGAYEDYNTDVTCNVGSVTVGPNIYSGKIDNKTVDNDSLYDIYIKCDVGSVEVNFTKQS